VKVRERLRAGVWVRLRLGLGSSTLTSQGGCVHAEGLRGTEKLYGAQGGGALGRRLAWVPTNLVRVRVS
jgi:hypothetical protein